MANGEDRTEAPSARRLERARSEGQAPMSRELPALAVLSSGGLLVAMLLPDMAETAAVGLRTFLAGSGGTDPAAGLVRALGQAAALATPFALAALFAGAAAVLLQTGFLFHASALLPDPARLDPRRGLRRVFGADSLFEAIKSLAKLAVVGWAGWRVMSALPPLLASAMLWSPGQLLQATDHEVVHLLLAMLGVQAAIAGADIVRVRVKHGQSLRMSRQDLREEHRDTEGDPQVKGRLRQLRVQRSRKRMLAAVPKAVVVVTNPTHYAVALAYERGRAAPRVVAKGVDDVAARIREVAREARVPIVPNPGLARALYLVPLDADVPPEHYQVVAELIAYVWRLRSRVAGARL